jgi:hypothetical protein
MCDYSLHGLPNRLAREGEDLVAHRFSTGAIGLASPADVCRQMQSRPGKQSFWAALKLALLPPLVSETPAVCIPPGATLLLSGIPTNLQRELGIAPDETVTFTQTTAIAQTFHDAIRFSNGRQLLLQFLKEGQRVRVLSLGGQEPEYAPERVGAEAFTPFA